MADWTDLPFAYASKLTSTEMTQLDSNLDAVSEGASGAPRVLMNAIDWDDHQGIDNAFVLLPSISNATGGAATAYSVASWQNFRFMNVFIPTSASTIEYMVMGELRDGIGGNGMGRFRLITDSKTGVETQVTSERTGGVPVYSSLNSLGILDVSDVSGWTGITGQAYNDNGGGDNRSVIRQFFCRFVG